jgi:hypothetical protein
LWEGPQDSFDVAAEADDRWCFGLLAKEAHDFVLPVDILSGKVGDVRLGSTQVPATFVVGATLKVELARDDGLVFGASDCTLLFEVDLWLPFLGEYRPG